MTTTWAELLHPGDDDDFFDRGVIPPFNPALSDYDRDNAWWLSELSRLVYRHDVPEKEPLHPPREFFLAKVGLHEVKFFNGPKTSAQAILVLSAKPAWAAVVFRGTEQDIGDFAADLADLHVTANPNVIDVHSGFKAQLDEIWADIERVLETLTCPIFYAGHSLGAALATLAAARRPAQATYAFGCPLVGNHAFAKSAARLPIHRVIGGRDIVTAVPPPRFGFEHAGTEHRIGIAKSKPTLTVTILRALRTLVRLHKQPPRYLADHAPKNYSRRLIES